MKFVKIQNLTINVEQVAYWAEVSPSPDTPSGESVVQIYFAGNQEKLTLRGGFARVFTEFAGKSLHLTNLA